MRGLHAKGNFTLVVHMYIGCVHIYTLCKGLFNCKGNVFVWRKNRSSVLKKADFNKWSSSLSCVLEVCSLNLNRDTTTFIYAFCGFHYFRQRNASMVLQSGHYCSFARHFSSLVSSHPIVIRYRLTYGQCLVMHFGILMCNLRSASQLFLILQKLLYIHVFVATSKLSGIHK